MAPLPIPNLNLPMSPADISIKAGQLIVGIGALALCAFVHANLQALPGPIFTLCVLMVLVVALQLLYRSLCGARAGGRWSCVFGALLAAVFTWSAMDMASSSFSRDDEIYSWNMWAVQHYLRIPYDYSHTGAPYPQLYSYWMAAAYLAQGGYVSHLLPRFLSSFPTLVVVLLPLTLLPFRLTQRGFWVFFAIMVAMLVTTNNKMNIGYADPIMTAAMAISAVLFVNFSIHSDRPLLLWLSAACAVVAGYSKQPGLIWGCFGFPVAVVYGVYALNWPRKAMAPALVVFAVSLIWPLLVAPSFVHNTGVIGRSLDGGSYLNAFLASAYRYFVLRPPFLAIFLAASVLSWRFKLLRVLMLTSVMPMLVLWFIFGSYQVRLGMHVVTLTVIILIASLVMGADRWRLFKSAGDARPASEVASGAKIYASLALTFLVAVTLLGTYVLAKTKHTDLMDGGKTTFIRQFGPHGGELYRQIVDGHARVWTSSMYSYGVFYARTETGRLKSNTEPMSEELIRRELIEFKADYAIYSLPKYSGLQSAMLKGLAERCPQAIIKILESAAQPDFIIYKVDPNLLGTGCAK